MLELIEKTCASDPEQTQATSVFLDKVKDLIKPQTISVNAPSVNINQDEVVNELKLVIQELKNNKPPIIENKEWEFKIIRGYGGNIDKVIATKK